jgi:hypothetical protein
MATMTPTRFVTHVENTLGLPVTAPLWQYRAREAAKLARWMTTHPAISIDDLLLAVEYCRRKHLPVRGVLGLTYHLADAAAAAHTPHTDPNADARTAALATLAARTDPDADLWRTRLQRTDGAALAGVLAELAASA